MNLWIRRIISIGFGILTIALSCGAVYEDYLVIPEGDHEGTVISQQKLANAIVKQSDFISEVSNISLSSEFYSVEAVLFPLKVWSSLSPFTVSFTLRTHSGSVYTDMQCMGLSTHNSGNLALIYCENDHVILTDTAGDALLKIPMNLIAVES